MAAVEPLGLGRCRKQVVVAPHALVPLQVLALLTDGESLRAPIRPVGETRRQRSKDHLVHAGQHVRVDERGQVCRKEPFRYVQLGLHGSRDLIERLSALPLAHPIADDVEAETGIWSRDMILIPHEQLLGQRARGRREQQVLREPHL